MIRKPVNRQKNEGDWLTTYSDLVTLLLTFFVLLFSFSEIDSVKWRDLVRSFTGKELIAIDEGRGDIIGDLTDIIGIDDGQIKKETVAPIESSDNTDSKAPSDDSEGENEQGQPDDDMENAEVNIKDPSDVEFERLYHTLLEYSGGEEQGIYVTMNEYQIRIRLSNHLLFDTGKAQITNENEKLLFDLTNIIVDFDSVINKIVIEGNTDNVPINNLSYKDNFELSLARSLSVLYFLKNHMNLVPQKLVPLGYGEYNPIGDNTTEEGKAKNRRTDIVLVKDIKVEKPGDIDYGFLGVLQNKGGES